MALIKCPHCGNTVSDTASVCIHCGKSLSSYKEETATTKPIEFTELSGSEKRNLQAEFERSYPKQKNFEEREKRLNKLKTISTVCIFVALGIVVLIYLLAKDSMTPLAVIGLVLGIVLFVVSDIIDFSCPFIIRKNKKKSLVALKMFQRWLKDKKGINYQVTFNESDKKWKQYFDGINVIVEGYKG